MADSLSETDQGSCVNLRKRKKHFSYGNFPQFDKNEVLEGNISIQKMKGFAKSFLDFC